MVLVASSNFLVPNTTFVVELVIFLLVIAFLAKYVLPPINRAMEARQETIDRTIAEAETAKKRAAELEERQRQELEEARQAARAMRDEATRTGDQLRQDLQRKGEEEYQRLVARAGADIEASSRKAAEQLRADMASLVMVVVERVLADGMTLADQERLVAGAIAEVEAQAAAARSGLPGMVTGAAGAGSAFGS